MIIFHQLFCRQRKAFFLLLCYATIHSKLNWVATRDLQLLGLAVHGQLLQWWRMFPHAIIEFSVILRGDSKGDSVRCRCFQKRKESRGEERLDCDVPV